jgi:hypothetical protein
MARSFRFLSMCITLLLVLALCSAVWAQPAPGGKSRPAMRGLGAVPSYGLALVYPLLLKMPTVQKELGLTGEQKAKITEALDKARAAMRELEAGVANAGDEDRPAKIEEAKKTAEVQAMATKKAIEDALLPKQIERLKGVALQRLGVAALMDKEVQRDLKLSDEQVLKIKEANDEKINKGLALRMSRESDPKVEEDKRSKIIKDHENQVMDALTAEQRVLLETLKGEWLVIPVEERMGGAAPPKPAGK